MPPEEGTKSEVLSGCPSLGTSSRNTEVKFESQIFLSRTTGDILLLDSILSDTSPNSPGLGGHLNGHRTAHPQYDRPCLLLAGDTKSWNSNANALQMDVDAAKQ
ncbi:hypothetical protein T265_04371 [Opisthorchis viverrini]|uniref:Uncharacterized protein n=1 Tax=Opisthorchis viverrini TaxID=6198 RepID=A0A074ZNE0_OPIVI|nr:hypothetical protein T265_04371 [Opisthorchis viverrini]KER28913.1 hypothetical protein T265_04371 [Opisthorchis viverrini]